LEVGAPENRIDPLEANALTPRDEDRLPGTWAETGLLRCLEFTTLLRWDKCARWRQVNLYWFTLNQYSVLETQGDPVATREKSHGPHKRGDRCNLRYVAFPRIPHRRPTFHG